MRNKPSQCADMTATTRVRLSVSLVRPRLFLNGISIALIGIALLFATRSNAASGITYQFDNEFSSGTPPAGPAPWITATIQNSGPGTVLLTVANNGLIG